MNVTICKKFKSYMGSLVYFYLCSMFSLFLFCFRNYYFDMTPTKYAYFTYTSLFLILGSFLGCIYYMVATKMKLSDLKRYITSFSLSDWAFIAMLLSHLITTLLSSYPMESFSGSEGRQMGLIFSFVLTCVYFIISRWYRQEQSIILVYLGSVGLVVMLGVLNFFGIDPLHFSDLLTTFDVQRFLSTIGNITFFAHLICLSLPISIVLYCYCEQKLSKILYGSSMVLGFIGLYISNLDGAYLGMIAFFVFLFMILCTSYEMFKKFLFVVIVALFTAKFLFILSFIMPEGRGFATISYQLVASNLSSIALLLLSALYVVYMKAESTLRSLNFRRVRKILIIIFFIFLSIILLSMCYFSFIDTTSDIGFLGNYLRYSDAWGTGRGFIWNRLFPLYINDFSISNKLFGSGLDTTRLLMIHNFVAGDIGAYDNAHNEYLQYLVTSGLSGLITYLVLFFSITYRLLKKGFQDPLLLGIAGCLIAHATQAITGLNQPITTPILFILLAIGENGLRNIHKTSIENKEYAKE